MRITNVTIYYFMITPQNEANESEEIEITPEMIEIGANVILCEVGGAELGELFSAPELATRVYLAMVSARP
jgi:hypothetical protein